MRSRYTCIGVKMGFLLLMILSGLSGLPARAQSTAPQNTSKEQQYKDHLQKGDVFLAKKDYMSAMLEYEKASALMPDEDQPKLKMQSIEATLGIEELAELKKKMAQAHKLEQQQSQQANQSTKAGQITNQQDFHAFIQNRQIQSKRDSIRKAIFEKFADELKRAEKGSDMSARAKVYREIADAFRAADDQEIALDYYNKALAIEQKFGQQEHVSEVYEDMAKSYFSNGNFQNSINSYEKSLELKKKSGDKAGASKVMSDIANVYETTYEYQEAIDYYQQSAKIKDSIKDDQGLKDVMNDLGDVYYKQKILTSSILSYEKTVSIIQKLDMKDALGPVYNKLGVAHYEMGNYTEAEKFFKESLKNLNENGNKKEASMTLNNLGNLLYIHNHYSDAISYYQRSLSTKKDEKYNFGRAVTLFNLGNAYRRSGDMNMAIKSYLASKRLADSLNIPSLSAKSCKALSVSYEASKNFDKAAELEQVLDSMKQSSVSIEIPVSENEMDLDHAKTQEILSKLSEEALKRKEMVESGADKKVTDLYISNLTTRFMQEQTKNKILIMIAVALVVIFAGTLILMRRMRKK